MAPAPRRKHLMGVAPWGESVINPKTPALTAKDSACSSSGPLTCDYRGQRQQQQACRSQELTLAGAALGSTLCYRGVRLDV